MSDNENAGNGDKENQIATKAEHKGDEAPLTRAEFSQFLESFNRFAEGQDKKNRNTRNRIQEVLKRLDPEFDDEKEHVSVPEQGKKGRNEEVNSKDIASLVLKELELANLKASLSDEQKKIVDSLDPAIAVSVVAAFRKQEEEKKQEVERPRVSVQDQPSSPGPVVGGMPTIKNRGELQRLLANQKGRELVAKWKMAGGSVADLPD